MSILRRTPRLISGVAVVLTLLSIVAGSFYYAHAHAAGVTTVPKPTGAFAPNPPREVLGAFSQTATFPCELPTAVGRCLSPNDFYKAYNVQPLLAKHITGSGRTIVIIDVSQGPTLASDLHLFDQYFGLPDPTLSVVAPFGLGKDNADDDGETALDVEWSHALAPNAAIKLVLAPSYAYADTYAATKYAVDNDLGDIISQSIQEPETCDPYVPQLHQVFEEAASKGITVFASSGDLGAANVNCSLGQNGAIIGQGINAPGDDPLVTSVGGTSLFLDSQGRYHDETTWNQSDFTLPLFTNTTTTGGYSALFAKPSYQNGIAAIGTQRAVPDVSLDADPNNGGVLVVCSSCDAKNPGVTEILRTGGTSASSPEWAGLAALADQLAGHNLGFLNVALYKIAKSSAYHSTFHDIVSGSNTFDFLNEYNGNTGDRVVGFSAQKGWDATTGWGTPNVANLLPLLAKTVTSTDAASVA